MEQQQLITIPAQTALQVFTGDKAIDPFLARIRQEIDGFAGSVDTLRGRKEIASMAYKVAQTKSYLDGVGKKLADEQKEIPKKIDACRKRVRDTLDIWKDEVRQPLTEWEETEERRVSTHRANVERILALASPADGRGIPYDAATLRQRLAEVEAVVIGPDCEELEAEYARAKDGARSALAGLVASRERYETEQAELARLRREEAERVAKEREAAIRAEAVERERARAESEAEAERDRVEATARAAREASERRELELKLAAEAAERRALETEQRVKREAEAAKAREAEEAARREANQRHRGSINRAAVAALVKGGIAEDVAKEAIRLIAQKAVPAVSIQY